VKPCRFLGEQLAPDTVVTTDVGQHSDVGSRKRNPVRRPRRCHLGDRTMGFGLPAPSSRACRAVDDVSSAPERRRLDPDETYQELATLADSYLPSRSCSSITRTSVSSVSNRNCFIASATRIALRRAAGFRGDRPCVRLCGVRIDALGGDPLAEIAAALAVSGPCLIDVPIHEVTNVLPMVPPGAANSPDHTAQPEPAMSDSRITMPTRYRRARTARAQPSARCHTSVDCSRVSAFNLEAIVCVSNVDDAGATSTMLLLVANAPRSIRSNDSLQAARRARTAASH